MHAMYVYYIAICQICLLQCQFGESEIVCYSYLICCKLKMIRLLYVRQS